MRLRFNVLAKFDYVLIVCISILSTLGILFIYSSGINSEGVNVSNEYQKQITWFSIGVVLMIAFTLFDYRRFKRYAGYIFGISIIVLLYTIFFGKNVNGARSWIGIKQLGIQPSEPVKIAYIIFLAWYLDRSAEENRLESQKDSIENKLKMQEQELKSVEEAEKEGIKDATPTFGLA